MQTCERMRLGTRSSRNLRMCAASWRSRVLALFRSPHACNTCKEARTRLPADDHAMKGATTASPSQSSSDREMAGRMVGGAKVFQ
eukprot:6200023-Pleurochrysis_carterae.AAC.3